MQLELSLDVKNTDHPGIDFLTEEWFLLHVLQWFEL